MDEDGSEARRVEREAEQAAAAPIPHQHEGRGEDEPEEREQRQARINLADILRILAGDRMGHEPTAPRSNDELVSYLRRRGAITNDLVYRAMAACPRALFVPAHLQRQAYVDAPIRVEEHGFNISAPHIHATALETLDLSAGDSFLDVGSGSGLMAAAGAFMVGPSGSVTSVDIRPAAITMCSASLRALKDQNPDYEAQSCPIHFELHNIFFPRKDFQARFSKVYIGAACPADRLAGLVKMLCPGGKMMVPVNSHLLLLTKLDNGSIRRQVISSVSFSDLEVPPDSEVLLSLFAAEQDSLTDIQLPESTLDRDMQAARESLAEGAGTSTGARPGPEAGAGAAGTHASAAGPGPGGWGAGGRGGMQVAGDEAGARLGVGTAGGASASGGDVDGGDLKRHKSGLEGSYLASSSTAGLGPTDCQLLVGAEQQWALPAHRALLTARCEQMRALFGSGMRDAQQSDITTPESFSREAVEGLLHWVYTDEMQLEGNEHNIDKLAELLHVACYYGATHLIALCEAALAVALHPKAKPRAKSSAPAAAAGAAGEAEGGAARPTASSFRANAAEAAQGDGDGDGDGAGGTTFVMVVHTTPVRPTAAGVEAQGPAAASARSRRGAAASTSAAAAAASGTGAVPVAEAGTPARCELALQLLMLALENGLTQLRTVALAFVADHFDAVAATEAWQQAPREVLDQVARHLAARHARLMALVHEVAGNHGSVGGRGSSAGGGNPLHHRYFLGESDEEDED